MGFHIGFQTVNTRLQEQTQVAHKTLRHKDDALAQCTISQMSDLISSALLPSIILAKALDVRSTRGFMSKASAALVSSHKRRVSSLMNFSSNSLRSCAIHPQVHSCAPRQTCDTMLLVPHLVRSAWSAVEATVVQQKVKYIRVDLRSQSTQGSYLQNHGTRCGREAVCQEYMHTCLGSTTGSACARPCPERSTSLCMKGDKSAT